MDQVAMTGKATTGEKSTAVAYVLWLLLGGVGAHRMYAGKMGSGLGMLGLCVGSIVTAPFLIGLLGFPALAVWWIVDAFMIPKWMNEGQGEPAIDASSLTMVEPPKSEAA